MKVNVTKDRVSIVESDDIHAGEYNVNNLQFSFSDEYSDNLVKNAIFTNDNGNSYQVSIINNKCQLPAEILAEKGSILFGVYAYQRNEEKLYSSDRRISKRTQGRYCIRSPGSKRCHNRQL